MALIQLNDVSITFRGPPLLDGVTCAIEPGQRIGLLGPQRLRQDDADADARGPGAARPRRVRRVAGREGRALAAGSAARFAGPRRPTSSSHGLPAEDRDDSHHWQAEAEGRTAAGADESAGRSGSQHALLRHEAARAAWPGRSSPSRTCCCSTSRRTISTSTPSAGSKIF